MKNIEKFLNEMQISSLKQINMKKYSLYEKIFEKLDEEAVSTLLTRQEEITIKPMIGFPSREVRLKKFINFFTIYLKILQKNEISLKSDKILVNFNNEKAHDWLLSISNSEIEESINNVKENLFLLPIEQQKLLQDILSAEETLTKKIPTSKEVLGYYRESRQLYDFCRMGEGKDYNTCSAFSSMEFAIYDPLIYFICKDCYCLTVYATEQDASSTEINFNKNSLGRVIFNKNNSDIFYHRLYSDEKKTPNIIENHTKVEIKNGIIKNPYIIDDIYIDIFHGYSFKTSSFEYKDEVMKNITEVIKIIEKKI